jgi:hypothetical protein
MKYALINANGLLEIREDSYELADGAIELTDEQYTQLCNGTSILKNGRVVNNPDFKPLGVV